MPLGRLSATALPVLLPLLLQLLRLHTLSINGVRVCKRKRCKLKRLWITQERRAWMLLRVATAVWLRRLLLRLLLQLLRLY